jgi:hypothetical protein
VGKEINIFNPLVQSPRISLMCLKYGSRGDYGGGGCGCNGEGHIGYDDYAAGCGICGVNMTEIMETI